MKRGIPDSREEKDNPAKKQKSDPRAGIEDRIRQLITPVPPEWAGQWDETKEWHDLKEIIKFEDLFVVALDGPRQGMSILMLAADKEMNWTFVEIWERFGERIELRHILDQVASGPMKGASVLKLLASRARHSESILRVWKRFGEDIQLADLLSTEPEILCPLLWLCSIECIRSLVDSILKQKSGIIPEEILNFYPQEHTFCYKRSIKDFLEPKSIDLILARNAFFRALSEVEQIDDTTFDSLMRMAQAAQAVGYMNAYYDLGQFFASRQEHGKASKAYQKVPKASKHYQEICTVTANRELTEALNSTLEYKRKKHLRHALEFAIKVEDDPTRFDLIEKIASLHIFNKPKEGQDNVVPADWIAVMNETTGLSWCVERLQDLETRENLKQEQRKLETELAELKAGTQNQQSKISHFLAGK